MPPLPTKKVQDKKSNRYYLLRYGSIAFQLTIALLVVIFLGVQVDKFIHLSFMLFSWLFPLFLVVGMIIKVIKDTSGKNEK